jgi:hypothetical protein
MSLVVSRRFNRRSATYQNGPEVAYSTAHVAGLR